MAFEHYANSLGALDRWRRTDVYGKSATFVRLLYLLSLITGGRLETLRNFRVSGGDAAAKWREIKNAATDPVIRYL